MHCGPRAASSSRLIPSGCPVSVHVSKLDGGQAGLRTARLEDRAAPYLLQLPARSQGEDAHHLLCDTASGDRREAPHDELTLRAHQAQRLGLQGCAPAGVALVGKQLRYSCFDPDHSAPGQPVLLRIPETRYTNSPARNFPPDRSGRAAGYPPVPPASPRPVPPASRKAGR